MATTAAVLNESVPTAEYARLEERILARDQKGASDVLYRLMKQGRPVTEITRESVRIHAPYTHVPYHQRLDDGIVKFVNNDHCFLSERVSLTVQSPVAQTRGYPTGNKRNGAGARFEPGEAIGWDQAHHVLYAGVPASAVDPRCYSRYEMGCNTVQNVLDGRDQELLRQDTPLTPAEEAMLVDVVTLQREFSVIEALVALLKAGRSARSILDAIQIAAAQVILEP